MSGLALPAEISRFSLHKRGGPAILFYGLFALAALPILQQAYSTVGDPFAAAQREANEIAEKKNQELIEKIPSGEAVCTEFENELCVKAELSEDAKAKEEAKAKAEKEEEAVPAKWDWLGSQAEADELATAEKDNVPLPSEYMPSFLSCILFMLWLVFLALFILIQHWSVRARCFFQYRPCAEIRKGMFVQVHPQKHQGQAEICEVLYSSKSDNLYFNFQRQKMEINEDDESVETVKCPSELPLRKYLQAQAGLVGSEDVGTALERYGKNVFDIPMPTFISLYKKQLSSPVAVFQLFCAALWCLDEYWKYTLFTLFTILMFEASTAFGRLKNLTSMRGMGNKPFPVVVYREGEWQSLLSDALLPGDLLSLKVDVGGNTVVPCDCLILQGNAVVNESTLTGESVPQMKGQLNQADYEDAIDQPLDVENKHKVHILYSGTLLMQSMAGTAKAPSIHAPPPPNNGCLCFVLRTGFSSSQGKLMRMIEYSQQQVTADQTETALLLLLLFCFALTSAGYVLHEGLQDPTRSKYQLLLRCVLILTSVVPPDLPMQMGLAVNMALMALLRASIFCTEPFRIPIAGKLTHCLFDKTGTLTTDQLVAAGVVNGIVDKKATTKFVPTKKASVEVAAVLGGCHSLIEVNDQLLGDPIEIASIRGIGWIYDPSQERAFPAPPTDKKEVQVATTTPAAAAVSAVEAKEQKRKEAEKMQSDLKKYRPRTSVQIVHRHHFQSNLQRMSVLAKFHGVGTHPDGYWSLVKGSPEALKLLIKPEALPAWYDEQYQQLAQQGIRVLALGYKKLPDTDTTSSLTSKPREWAETGLSFAGFIGFTCLPRKDTSAVIYHLKDSGHHVAMITGDAALTALHVAKDVGITGQLADKALILEATNDGIDPKLEWRAAIVPTTERPRPFVASAMGGLVSDGYDLMVTGKSLMCAVRADPEMWSVLDRIAVFARMSPEEKGDVIKALKDHGHKTLMCGDGGNDVGALKQAHVGLALLSGWNNFNADTTKTATGLEEGNKQEEIDHKKKKAEAEQALKNVEQEAMSKFKNHRDKHVAEFNERRKALMATQPQRLQDEIARRAAGGETGMMASVKATAKVMADIKQELAEIQRQTGAPAAKNDGGLLAAQAALLGGEGENNIDDGSIPMVKLGDASIASSFTSKMPSIKACLDIIRQGRCTLVNTLQQQQILMLNCMISAYSLAVRNLEGGRSSEAQLMSTGILLTVAGLSFSFAKPCDKLSPVLPLSSIFHRAIFISLIGQLVIHLGAMIYCVQLAKHELGETGLQREVSATKFKPNLYNTVIFFVQTMQQVSVMTVNYKGRPWMTGVTENQGLLYSLGITGLALFIAVTEVTPTGNEYLGLVPLPSDSFKYQMLLVLIIGVFGSLIWDRLCVAIFAPTIFKASMDELRELKMADFGPPIKSALFVGGGLFLFLYGGIWGMIGAYWLYSKRKQSQAAAAAAAAGGAPVAGTTPAAPTSARS